MGNGPKLTTYLITEKFRRDWKFKGLRHGQSAAWVRLEHPYGFEIEINKSAFEAIANKITMVNGRMITPCYFKAKLKNAEMLVQEDDGQNFFYSLIKSITDDKELVGKLEEIITDERPDRVYKVLSGTEVE
jgi:hypothetical protein